MLLYDNRSRLRILLQIHGSIYKRIWFPMVMCSAYCLTVFYLFREYPEHAPTIDHPFASQSFGTLIAFAVCFRVNIAWNRFWEACQEVTMMFSKWSDAYSQLQGFVNSTIKIKLLKEPGNSDIIDRLNHARCEITHMFTVLSAVAVERLIRGDISRMEMRTAMGVGWSEQVAFRQNLRNKDLTGSKVLLPIKVVRVKQHSALAGISESDSESEGEPTETGETHKEKPNGVRTAFHHTQSQWSDPQLAGSWGTPVSVVGQLSKGERTQLEASKDRPGLVLLWLGELVTDLQPYLMVPPPILSRVYQELSNGALGFSQAMKLSDLPFPFVFAQALALAILVLAAISPISMIAITGDSWMTPVLSIGVVVSFWGLNEIAKELENPFGEDPNDYPLYDAHERFAEHIVELHGSFVPLDRGFTSKKKERFSIYEQQQLGLGPGGLAALSKFVPTTPIIPHKSGSWHSEDKASNSSFHSVIPSANANSPCGGEDLQGIVPSIVSSIPNSGTDQLDNTKATETLLAAKIEVVKSLPHTTEETELETQVSEETLKLRKNSRKSSEDSLVR